MENFNFYNPVHILFGKGKLTELADQIPTNAKVLITYGGGSIKQNGIYQKVMEALKNHNTHEFGGIEANPSYETCMLALQVIKEKHIDFLLAVGGGSVLDATKFMAAALPFKGTDPWDILAKGAEISSALPIGCVLTLPATGSEMNGNSVISKKATQEKLAFGSPLVLPRFSLLDPEFTYSLPKRQVSNGIIDAFVHVMEQYLTYPVNSPIQDRMAEGILLTLIEEGRKAMALDTPDYENRANLMWAATMALNGLIAAGTKSDWATHVIGHELTAFHGLDHAVTLSIVLPGLLNQKKEERKIKLLQYGARVWQVNEGSEAEKLALTIQKTEAFFREMGALTKLSEHHIGNETIHRIVKRFQERGSLHLGAQQDITLDEVALILESRL